MLSLDLAGFKNLSGLRSLIYCLFVWLRLPFPHLFIYLVSGDITAVATKRESIPQPLYFSILLIICYHLRLVDKSTTFVAVGAILTVTQQK